VLQRFLLWQLRNETVEPFGETGQQVFARISALRDSLDGAQVWQHMSCTCGVFWTSLLDDVGHDIRSMTQ